LLFGSLSAALVGAATATPEPGFVTLFDGTEASFADWEVAGLDGFALEDGVIVSRSVDEDLGLLYYAPRPFSDFVLRLQVRILDSADNSGIFIRFRDPRQPLPDSLLAASDAVSLLPNRADYATNGAWIGVDTGFEVQIDELAAGDVPDQDLHRTGAIYDIPIGSAPGEQVYQRGSELQPGEWHDLEVTVVGQTYTVLLDGEQTAMFTNLEPRRGLPAAEDADSGYIGVQSHPFNLGRVEFRDIRIRELPLTSNG
jgi:hypothetical protein